jgi:hypothetical protein
MVALALQGTGAIGAVVARFVHTEEVTGSNPVSPTPNQRNTDNGADLTASARSPRTDVVLILWQSTAWF